MFLADEIDISPTVVLPPVAASTIIFYWDFHAVETIYFSMVGQSGYVPPPYIPLGQSDVVVELDPSTRGDVRPTRSQVNDEQGHWSSGICACFDDIQSCVIGLICPCYLFGKNAEFLGSGTMMGSCTTHFVMWALINTFCCILTDGGLLGLPGCFVACYACGYRRTLRLKYNLEEAPCGDFFTHFFCHLCAICQEYREIRERNDNSDQPTLDLTELTAPTLQTMQSPSSTK